MGATIALLSRKGGVGKTSLSIHLAGLLAQDGLRTRLVDLDNQASLTQFFLGAEATENLAPAATVEALTNGRRPAEVERETRTPNLTIVPAHFRLELPRGTELDLSAADVAIQILDTPPDLLNPAIRAALLAANFALSPIVPEIAGIQSIASVQRALHATALASNPGLRLLGYAINLRQRLASHTAVEQMLRRLHGDTVLQTTIPSAAAFKEAYLAGRPIHEHDPRSQAAAAIRRLWEECLDRIANATPEAA